VVAAKLEIVKSLATMGSATGKLGKEVKDLAPMFGDTFGGMDKGLHGLMESAADTAKRFKKTIKTMYGEQETSSYKKRLQEMSELYGIPIDKLDEFVSLTKKVSQGDVTGKVMKQYAESLAEAALAMNNAGKLAADDKGIESLNTASALIKSAIAASTAEEKMKLLSAALVDMDGELAKSETLLDPTPLQKYAAEATKAKASLQDMAVDGVQSLENSLLDLAKGTKSASEAFKSMANSIVDDITRMAIKQQITGPLSGMLNTAIGSMFTPATGFNGAFGGDMSFAGGGFTGRGARSGGVDGKGGFPAVLHPNETVVDHTKGQQTGGASVVQNFNITTGVQQTVRAEIMNMMPQIAEAAKAAVADGKQRGGSYSAAFA